MELNTVGRPKFGYVQQSVLSRSGTDLDHGALDNGVAETMS